jgi:hypothetical protein
MGSWSRSVPDTTLQGANLTAIGLDSPVAFREPESERVGKNLVPTRDDRQVRQSFNTIRRPAWTQGSSPHARPSEPLRSTLDRPDLVRRLSPLQKDATGARNWNHSTGDTQ